MIHCTNPIGPGRLAALCAVGLLARAGLADQVTLVSVRDNTLIQTTDGSLSNGAGDGIYSGRVGVMGGGTMRRAVLAFDVAGAVPSGSTITSATLTLTLVNAAPGFRIHSLHRLLTAWGEGASIDFGGQGAPSEPGDATWIHTYFPDQYWAVPGGDYVPTACASQSVGVLAGPVVWATTPAMVADVQLWLDDPASNFGWILIGDESVVHTAKKFASREWPDLALRPKLTVEFTLPCPADIDGDGDADVADFFAFVLAFAASDPLADINGDGSIDVSDFFAFVAAFAAGCG